MKQPTLENKKIYKYAPIAWRGCEWLQPKKFKSRLQSDIDKLKNSLLENDFIMPFFVSEKIAKDKLYILDGHGRRQALEQLERDGHSIPDKLPALFLDVGTRKEALRLLLLYNSSYGVIRKSELTNLLAELDIETESEATPFALSNVLDDVVIDERPEAEAELDAERKNNAVLSFGVFNLVMYRFKVQRDIFDTWLRQVKKQVGLKDQDIIAEFKRRIGVTEHEQASQKTADQN